MTQKMFFFFIIFITLINIIIFGFTIGFINPEATGKWGFIFFYSSLFLLLFGAILFISYFVHVAIMRWTSTFKNIQVSTRHGLLFSLLITGSLMLQSRRLLSLLNLVLLVLLLTFIEFLFILKRSSAHYGRKTPST